jgi:hypothetical protein
MPSTIPLRGSLLMAVLLKPSFGEISFSGMDRNGSPSNIYSGSESTSLFPGDGGTIFLSAKTISLSSQAFLSTSSKGNGKSGNIELQAESIYLDDLSAITSGSESEKYLVEQFE